MLRSALQESSERARLLSLDVTTLRKTVLVLGNLDKQYLNGIDSSKPEVIRARQIYNAIRLVDGLGDLK
jgi:hypothetical protein